MSSANILNFSQKSNLACWSSSKTDIIIISLKCSLFSPWYGWNIVHVVLNNNHSPYMLKSVFNTALNYKSLSVTYMDKRLEVWSRYQLHFNEMMMISVFELDQHAKFDFCYASSLKQLYPGHSTLTHYHDSEPISLYSYSWMLHA
jgi:hypothetical protein